LPSLPGVYWWQDAKNNLLYVGKAKNLKNRLLSYQQLSELNPRIRDMVGKATSLHWQVLESELEALLVEAQLINTYQPSYNILLKDDKSWLYIVITKEEWPRVIRVRRREAIKKRLAGQVFGPFPSSYKVNEVLNIARKIFPWCNAKRDKKMRRCFYQHLSLCPGVCTDTIARDDYLAILKNLGLFLRGQKKRVLQEMRRELKSAAAEQEYERAALLRDQITAVEEVTSQSQKLRQDVFLPKILDEQNKDALVQLSGLLHEHLGLPAGYQLDRIEGFDVSNTSGKQAVVSMVVFTEGLSDQSQYRLFNIKTLDTPNDFAMMAQALKRRSEHDEWIQPSLIVIDGGRGQVSKVIQSLENTPLRAVPVIGLAKRPDRLVLPATDTDAKRLWQALTLLPGDPVLHLLEQIRDEAHRFGKKHHVSRRSKALFD
jgi:excinuclease ABC subunit C